MNLTLRQLHAFIAVAELGSFTAAAGKLHLTQSALSVLVRELEQAVAEVGALRDKRRGRLRLAMPQLMASTLGARAIAAFHAQHPDVTIELHDTPTDQIVSTVLSGRVELAISVDVPDVEDIERRVLMRDRHWLVCPAGHRLAALPKVRWKDLQAEPFIAPTRDFMRWLAPLLSSAELMPQVAHTVAYVSTALGLAASGLGVTMVPTYGQPLARAWGLVCKPVVAPVFERDVQIYSSRGRSLSPAAEAFVKVLIDAAARPRQASRSSASGAT